MGGYVLTVDRYVIDSVIGIVTVSVYVIVSVIMVEEQVHDCQLTVKSWKCLWKCLQP